MRSCRVVPCGDSAVTAVFPGGISAENTEKVRALSAAIEKRRIAGVTGTIPAYSSLTVCYDPLRLSGARIARIVGRLAERTQTAKAEKKTVHLIPVLYGGAYGEDLPFVARCAGLSCGEAAALHAGTDYLIHMIGFLPGFAYLGGLDERLAVPRLDSPRAVIPAGSVGIGGGQTGIYPVSSPGGWRLIGRTPLRMYDPDRDPPVLYRPGEYIRFVPVDESAFAEMERAAEAGTVRWEVREETV